MKTIVLANQKGGVGKSAIAVQLAYFFRLIMGKRVLVIDLDHQRNTSSSIENSVLAKKSAISSTQILTMPLAKGAIEDAEFVLIAGDDDLVSHAEPVNLKSEEKKKIIKPYMANMHNFLMNVSDKFDVCIIDTHPNPDIRHFASLVASDYVLSPLQLNQEAINGIGDLLNHESLGIRRMVGRINPRLKLIGILPNLVEASQFQKQNLRDLSMHYGKLLIPLGVGVCQIKRTTAIPEAQAAGVPVWKLGKTSGRDAWAQIKPVFEKIASIVEVQ